MYVTECQRMGCSYLCRVCFSSAFFCLSVAKLYCFGSVSQPSAATVFRGDNKPRFTHYMLPVKVQAADRHCRACEYLAAKEPDISPQALVGSKM